MNYFRPNKYVNHYNYCPCCGKPTDGMLYTNISQSVTNNLTGNIWSNIKDNKNESYGTCF